MIKDYGEALGLVTITCELYIKGASKLIGADIIGNQIKEALNTITQVNVEYKKVLSIIKEKGYDDYLLEEFDTFEAYKKNFDKFYADQLVIDWNDKEQLVELRIYTEEEFDLMKRYHNGNNL